MRLRVGNVPNITGFTVSNVPANHYFWALVSARLTSDDQKFYQYIEEISRIFLSSSEYSINPNSINNFLILIHPDMSADIYLGNFPVEVRCLSKRILQEGIIVADNDIADMRELRFPGIEIKESDSIICCLKIGWKFGLYFDLLGTDRTLDIAAMQLTLGQLYRYLSFEYVYQSLKSEPHFEEMINDGWFPFVDILGNEYKGLASTYQNEKFAYDDKVKQMLESFNENRVKEITEKWWQNPFFQKKQQLLQAGIDAFLQKNESGYINCVKNLYTEIEGIMRDIYYADSGKSNPSTQEFINYLVAVAKHNVDDNFSLLLPQQFLGYLTKYIFRHFDVATGAVNLSRHSVAHGAAEGKDYTPEKALQGLLTLNQIYFYLIPPPNNEVE